jgi:hypothetical protein
LELRELLTELVDKSTNTMFDEVTAYGEEIAELFEIFFADCEMFWVGFQFMHEDLKDLVELL